MKKYPATNAVLRIAGCGPYCHGGSSRDLSCQSCHLRYHVNCVDQELISRSAEGVASLSECTGCKKRKRND